MKHEIARKRTVGGFTLIEVLIGILVFALGMMALASLQSNLAKNSSDANARTVAINIGEEVIEAVRAFNQITSDGTTSTYADIFDDSEVTPGSINFAYNDMIPGSLTVSRGGYDYLVVADVTDYYYDAATETFTTTVPLGAARSDLKLLVMTVSSNHGLEFNIDQDTPTTGRLGSGSIQLTEVISSITSPAGGKVALSSDGTGSYAPPVNYNPGENPDIISIQLGANKFKESTTPLPDVVRAEELVETRFDVVTYSQDNAGATFLRREEFRAVSCECTLRIPDTNAEGGYRPTVWDGNEYSEPEFVSKPYGESANNQQSDFCDICCRDHHDGGTGADDDPDDTAQYRYAPFSGDDEYYTEGALSRDHKHYNRDNNGQMVLAQSDGDTYAEVCRMVRKDGFFRIAQDLRQEALNAFPGDYLDSPEEVGEYSDYVTDAVIAFEGAIGDNYELSAPAMPAPTAGHFPASTAENPTQMSQTGVDEQQLRSRGVYIDYMSDELRWRINCLDMGMSGETCEVPDVTNSLEIIPFYDVQLTWLTRWTETPTNDPVEVTNEAIKNNNEHSRGVASLTSATGVSIVNSEVHMGNLGLTGTDPIDPWYGLDLEDYDLHAVAGVVEDPPPPQDTGYIITGDITSSVPGLKASDVEIEFSDANCDRTSTGYQCVVPFLANNPRLTVRNYFKLTKLLFACSDIFDVHGNEHSGESPALNWTRFNLPKSNVSGGHIVIRENSCL